MLNIQPWVWMIPRFGRGTLALVAALGTTGSAKASGNYSIHTWQAEDGLPQNVITAVVPTREGYIWVGTYNGLARFDGVRFKDYNSGNTPGMSSSRVTSLLEDHDGNLWIGHEGGELTRFKSGRFEAVAAPTNWSPQAITYLVEDEAHCLWLTSREGELTRLQDGLTYLPTVGPGAGIIKSRALCSDGRIWVGRNGVISALEGGRWKTLDFDEAATGNYVQAVCPSRRGGLWVVRNEMIRRWNNGKWEEDWGLAPWGRSGGINGLVETQSGTLAAGSASAGLFLISGEGKVQHYSRTNGLGSDWVQTVCQDQEGNLWVGTHDGLVMLRETCIEAISPPDKWQGRAALSVAAGKDDAVWVGTEGGGLYRRQGEAWSHFGSEDGLPSQYIWSVSEDASGCLWGGTWDSGAFVQQGDHFQPAPGLDFPLGVRAFLQMRKNDFLVGTTRGLLHFQDGKTNWIGIEPRAKAGTPDVRAIAVGPQGRVWFGMFGAGLGCIKDGNVTHFGKSDGLSSDYVQCLRAEADGSLWIGTFGGGLSRLKQGKFSMIGESQGLPDNVICDIEADGHGFFWISTPSGIMRAGQDELNRCADGLCEELAFRKFDVSDGMPTGQCSGGSQPAGCRTADGRLWFPTAKGLVVIDPNDVKLNERPPPVIIEDATVDGRLAFVGGMDSRPMAIPPGAHRIEFRYTGLSLAAPDKVRFKYRLVGLDQDWISAGNSRVANYAYIPPGEHTFQVIACNNDGVWNQSGASLAFTSLPYFWQTIWFRVFGGGMTLAAGGGIVWLDARRRTRSKLERLERQRSLEKERTRIANDIHDDLGIQLTRIGMLCDPARVASRGSERAAADLNQIYHATHELTRAMDEIVWAVNPHHDTLESLVNYLHKFAQDFLETTGLRCRLDVPIQLPAWPLFAEVRHNLFLAFKEALNNAVKHANASEARISLSLEASGFSLVVEDNGRGFVPGDHAEEGNTPPSKVGTGNGLKNMKHRLAEVGGRCEIRSVPGLGTKVTFVVPLALENR